MERNNLDLIVRVVFKIREKVQRTYSVAILIMKATLIYHL